MPVSSSADSLTQEHAARFHIAILPGDGIGPEVTAEAVRVLRAVEQRLDGVRFDLREHSVGAGEYLRSGDPLPNAALDACRAADAVLLGAMGLPNVRWPNGKEMTPQIDLREILDLYAGVRPVRLYHECDTPLKRYGAGEIDFVIVRESTEGLFSARLSEADSTSGEVRDVMRITRRGAERVCRFAFELARTRRNKVTLVDKANVLPSMVFFRQVFQEVAKEYSDVAADCIYVDAAALYFVQRPQTFDVLVTENMFGDISQRPGCGTGRWDGHGAVGGHRREARGVSTLPRHGAGHRRPRPREPDRDDPFRRTDARLVSTAPDRSRGGDDARCGGERACQSRTPHARLARHADHARNGESGDCSTVRRTYSSRNVNG